MKMKIIAVTEDNINYVYGRLKRFFSGSYGFEEWHNFNCGFKKRISNKVKIGDKRLEIVHQYPSIECIERVGEYIVIRIDDQHGQSVKIGDKIAFLSNRITIKEWCAALGEYVYTTYQVKHFDEEKSREIEYARRMEN